MWDVTWSVPISLAVFLLSAVVIGVVGTRLTGLGDRLADQTGLGEAFVGAVFLGAATSLPGITASVTAALDGYASLALSNAVGGIAAQTVFLALADLTYREANLEHAAASVPNMLQASLLVILLAVMLLGMVGPNVSWLGLHPVTPLLLAVYLGGIRMVQRAHNWPMWRPRVTHQTRVDTPDEPTVAEHRSLAPMWVSFIGSAVLVIVAGWAVTQAIESIADQTALNHTIAGGVFIAVVTSLPELVTSVAAVRRGALTLAIGGVVGGNAFDTLFAAVSDVAYRSGSIYHAATTRELAIIVLTVLMTSVLLMGLLRRERSGIARMGFESFFILVIYLAGLAMIGLME